MTTTIQIDDDTKKKLFEIKLKLENEKGTSVSYNELINYLIKNQVSLTIKREYLKEFRTLKGILPKSALTEFYQEKEKERLKEEQRAPLKTQKT